MSKEQQLIEAKRLIRAAEKIEGKKSIIMDLLHPTVAISISMEGYNMKSAIFKDRRKSYTEVFLDKVDHQGKISVFEEVA